MRKSEDCPRNPRDAHYGNNYSTVDNVAQANNPTAGDSLGLDIE